MFADTGVTLPGYVKLTTAGAVADGVLDAVRRDRAEVDVMAFSAAPERAGRHGRARAHEPRSAGGSDPRRSPTEFAAAQRDKR